MDDIREYGAGTTSYEVLSHLGEKIARDGLSTFNELKSYTSPLPESLKTSGLLRKAFELQKMLYWGFFKDISRETHPRIWDEIVMSDDKYKFAGDLKRLMSIPDIYMGLADIHGYTKFCNENRRNLSMLDLLDRMIQDDIGKIARSVGVVSRRSRGDEILLLGASAEDTLETVLLIVDYFSKRKRIPNESGQPARADYDIVLPEFRISAGIAGGQKFTPLVITRDGDLSGDIVNTAARLQSRADKISPDRNRILLTSHVYQKLKAPKTREHHERLAAVEFFNAGTVQFKGVSIGVYDTVFMETESYRLSYRDLMDELYESIDKGMWKSKIFEDAMKLAARVLTNLPTTAFAKKPADLPLHRNRNELLGAVKNANDLFAAERYERAIAELQCLLPDFASIEGFDDIVFEYLSSICQNYATLLTAFTDSLDKEVEEHMDAIYLPKEQENFRMLRKHFDTFDKVREAARLKVRGRKTIWFRTADAVGSDLKIRIHSKK
jgi:class 3 adenylate cyclase